MGHTGEGHKEFVQKNKATTSLSVYHGLQHSTVLKSLDYGIRLLGINSQIDLSLTCSQCQVA